jgi:hypothetical protein
MLIERARSMSPALKCHNELEPQFMLQMVCSVSSVRAYQLKSVFILFLRMLADPEILHVCIRSSLVNFLHLHNI